MSRSASRPATRSRPISMLVPVSSSGLCTTTRWPGLRAGSAVCTGLTGRSTMLSWPTVMSREATRITRQMNRYRRTTKPTWRSSRSCLTKATLEREPGRAHADHVSVHERCLPHSLAVHLRAVGRPQVDQLVALAQAPDLGVAARYFGVVDDDVAPAGAADDGDALVERHVAAVPQEHRLLAPGRRRGLRLPFGLGG